MISVNVVGFNRSSFANPVARHTVHIFNINSA